MAFNILKILHYIVYFTLQIWVILLGIRSKRSLLIVFEQVTVDQKAPCQTANAYFLKVSLYQMPWKNSKIKSSEKLVVQISIYAQNLTIHIHQITITLPQAHCVGLTKA